MFYIELPPHLQLKVVEEGDSTSSSEEEKDSPVQRGFHSTDPRHAPFEHSKTKIEVSSSPSSDNYSWLSVTVSCQRFFCNAPNKPEPPSLS